MEDEEILRPGRIGRYINVRGVDDGAVDGRSDFYDKIDSENSHGRDSNDETNDLACKIQILLHIILK